MGKFARSWSLAKASMGVLRSDKELLVFPLISSAVALVVALSFILSLLSGFAIYSPWLYRSITPLFGGGPISS